VAISAPNDTLAASGVSSVTFYLDGHRLVHLTSRNAHRGLLSVRINPSKLRIVATMTLSPTR